MARKSFLRYVGEIFKDNGNHRMLTATLVQKVHEAGYQEPRHTILHNIIEAHSNGYLESNGRWEVWATHELEKKVAYRGSSVLLGDICHHLK